MKNATLNIQQHKQGFPKGQIKTMNRWFRFYITKEEQNVSSKFTLECLWLCTFKSAFTPLVHIACVWVGVCLYVFVCVNRFFSENQRFNFYIKQFISFSLRLTYHFQVFFSRFIFAAYWRLIFSDFAQSSFKMNHFP